MKNLYWFLLFSAFLAQNPGLAQTTTENGLNSNGNNPYSPGFTTPTAGSSPFYSNGGISNPTSPYGNPPTNNSGSFPTFPQNPASSLLPSWNVGASGSFSNSGSGNFGNGSYSNSGSFNYNNSGNFPNQNGGCGVTGYADIAGAKSLANSQSNSTDLNTSAIVARAGVSVSNQKCLNYKKLLEIGTAAELEKVKITENAQTHRRCIEGIVEAMKLGKDTDKLMQFCKDLMPKE
jgi:hypothetical protein